MMLSQEQERIWKDTLEFWNHPRLKDPQIFDQKDEADRELGDEIAMFDFSDSNIKVHKPNLEEKLGEKALSPILDHEVGHPALIPYNFRTCVNLILHANEVLKDTEKAQYLENIFADMIVNTHLYRHGRDEIKDVYQNMQSDDPFWNLYMHTYERLWDLPSNSLAMQPDETMKADASKIEDIVNGSMYNGSKWNAAIEEVAKVAKKYLDKKPKKKEMTDEGTHGDESNHKKSKQKKKKGGGLGEGEKEYGAVDSSKQVKTKENETGIDYHHPADFLPGNDLDPNNMKDRVEKELAGIAKEHSKKNYTDTMEDLGFMKKSAANKAFYKDIARTFSIDIMSESFDGSSTPYSIREWTIDDPVEELDIARSLEDSPFLIPEYTTKKWDFKEEYGKRPDDAPRDLLILMDSSGSMPNPKTYLSIPVVGALVCAKASLEGGNSVGVLNFSSNYQALDFTTDYEAVTEYLTSYLNQATTIPGHKVEEMVEKKFGDGVDILMITDTEIGNLSSELESLEKALKKANGSGTIFLFSDDKANSDMLSDIGYKVFKATTANDLLDLSLGYARDIYNG